MTSLGSGRGPALAGNVACECINGAIAAGLEFAGVCRCGVEKIGRGVFT